MQNYFNVVSQFSSSGGVQILVTSSILQCLSLSLCFVMIFFTLRRVHYVRYDIVTGSTNLIKRQAGLIHMTIVIENVSNESSGIIPRSHFSRQQPCLCISYGVSKILAGLITFDNTKFFTQYFTLSNVFIKMVQIKLNEVKL